MIIQVGKVFPYHCHGFLCILLFCGIVLLNMNRGDLRFNKKRMFML